MKKNIKKILLTSSILAVSSLSIFALSTTQVIQNINSSSAIVSNKKAISNNIDRQGEITNQSSLNIPSTYFYLNSFDDSSTRRFNQWDQILAALNYYKNLPENLDLVENSVAAIALNELIQIFQNLENVKINIELANKFVGKFNDPEFIKNFNEKNEDSKFLGVTPQEAQETSVEGAKSVFNIEEGQVSINPNLTIQNLIGKLNGFVSIGGSSKISLVGNLNSNSNSSRENTPEIVNLENGIPNTPSFVNLGNGSETGVSTIIEIAEINSSLNVNENIILDFSYTGVENGTAANFFNDATALSETEGKLVLVNENGEFNNISSVNEYLSDLNVFGRWLSPLNATEIPEKNNSRPEFLDNFVLEKIDKTTYKIYVKLKPNQMINNISISSGNQFFNKFGILDTQILQTKPIIDQNTGNVITSIPFFESITSTTNINDPNSFVEKNQVLDIYLGNGEFFASNGIYIKGVSQSSYTQYDIASEVVGGGRIRPNLEIINNVTDSSSNISIPLSGNAGQGLHLNTTILGIGTEDVPLNSADININSKIFRNSKFSQHTIEFNKNLLAVTIPIEDAATNTNEYNSIFSLIRQSSSETNALLSKKIFFRKPLTTDTSVGETPDESLTNVITAREQENILEKAISSLAEALKSWEQGNPIFDKSFSQELKIVTFDGTTSNKFTNIKLDQILNLTELTGKQIYDNFINIYTNYEAIKDQIITTYIQKPNPFEIIGEQQNASTVINNIFDVVSGSLSQKAVDEITAADPESNPNSDQSNYNEVVSNQLNILIQETYTYLQDQVKTTINKNYTNAISEFLNTQIIDNDVKKIPNIDSFSLSTSEIPLFNLNRTKNIFTSLENNVIGSQIFEGIFNWLKKDNLGIGIYSSTSPIINKAGVSLSLNQIFANYISSNDNYANLYNATFFNGEDTGNSTLIEQAFNLYKELFNVFSFDIDQYQEQALLKGDEINFSAFSNSANNNANINDIVKNMYTNLSVENKNLKFNVFGNNISTNHYLALISAANIKLTLENIKSKNTNNTSLINSIDNQLKESLFNINNIASYSALINQTNVNIFNQDFSSSATNQSIREQLENSNIEAKPLFVSNSLQSTFGTSLNQSAPIIALTFFALIAVAMLATAGYVLIVRKKSITFKNAKGLKLTLSSMIILGIILLVVIVPIAVIL